MPKCKACGGTGVMWSMRSWFAYDGYRRGQCWWCQGSGKSQHEPDAELKQRQRIARERVAADARWSSQDGAAAIARERDVFGYTPGDTYVAWKARQQQAAPSGPGAEPR